MAETAASLKERPQRKVEWKLLGLIFHKESKGWTSLSSRRCSSFILLLALTDWGWCARARLPRTGSALHLFFFFFFFSKRLREERVVCLEREEKKRTTWRTTVRTLCAQNLPVASVLGRHEASVVCACVSACVFLNSSEASRRKKKEKGAEKWTGRAPPSWAGYAGRSRRCLPASPREKTGESERQSGEEVCAGCRGFQLLVSGSLS